MVFLVLVCEKRTLPVLRLHSQLSSGDREVWREANVRCLHEKMNAAATILASEEWSGAQHLQLGSSAGCSVAQHLQHKEAAWTFINFNHYLWNLKWQSISLTAVIKSVLDNALSSAEKRRRNADSKFLGKINLSEKGRKMPHIGLNKSLHWFLEPEPF